ncbi:F-BOX/LRR-REPEAT PROTEIN 12 [Salix koriyanagi]|uniref:F-BOX/LRR-REPEAT PROTEIN 12 n=1 Tax=Salix koriyanagi TaxID=2511006 RepID=A0A9Q0Z743_9ROSI|nr:F-BOX/LRR-REPEAT PROTEIN 12 [Salix koriyanagi]
MAEEFTGGGSFNQPDPAKGACCSCGYPLNLTSSNRITSNIGSGYKKSIKKGYISFLSVDLSRFTQVDEVNCLPVSWGRYRSKSKLLCRKCGVHVGYGYGDSPVLCGFDSPNSSSSAYKKFTIKIRALQPPEDCLSVALIVDHLVWLVITGLLLAPSNFTGCCYSLQHLQCLSILQSHALKLLSHNLDCCFGITGNGLSLVAASCSSLEYLIAGVNGSGLGGFSPPSIHMDDGGRNLEPEGIIGIASGGGVEYLNVSCVKWLCKWRRSAGIGALLVTKSIAAIA